MKELKPARRRAACAAILLLVLAPAARAAGDEPAAANFAELERVAIAELKESNTPGAAVAVVMGDRVVFAKGFGAASVETGAPVTTDMLFRLGSTTKMFTGAALVALAAGGRLKMDEPVGGRVPGLHPKLARLTPHQLASNSAGVADFAAPFVSNDDDALARMVRGWKEDALFAEPGRVYSYSSPGFWLAGHVVESVAAKPYADAMAELVFRPLGMTRTTLRPLVAMTYPLAAGHDAKEGGGAAVIRPAFNNVAQWPAGSVYSSADELARWASALLNGCRLDGKQALAAEVCAKLPGQYVSMPGAPEVHYGYGLLNFEDRGVRVVMHGGFSRGYGSMVQLVPSARLAVVVVTNRSGQTLPKTREKVLDLLLARRPAEAEKPKAAQPLTAAEAANFAGRYVNGPQTWEVADKEGKLFLKHPQAGEVQLRKTGPYRLSFGESLENDLAFVPDALGRIEFVFDGLYSGRKQP